MFGTNEVLPTNQNNEMSVTFIESRVVQSRPWRGQSVVWVSMAGCSLQCTFCDVDKTSLLLDDPEMFVDEVNRLDPTGKLGVVISGGEPFRQSSIFDFIRRMSYGTPDAFHRKILIETSGYIPVMVSRFTLATVAKLIEQGYLTLVVSPKMATVNDWIAAHAQYWNYIVRNVHELSPLDGLPEFSTQAGEDFSYNRICRPPDRPGVVVTLTPEVVYQLTGPIDPIARAPVFPINLERTNANLLTAVEVADKFGYLVSDH